MPSITYRSATRYRRQLMSYRGAVVVIRDGRRTARPEATSLARTTTAAGNDRTITDA